MRAQSARAAAALLVALLVPFAVTVAEPPEPGDRGYALTAVRGDEIEKIPVEFLGTLKDGIGPGYDLHLVRLEGPIADRVGVAAGMSGSPVYFDGELLGALAYRMGFLPTEPIAGITPVADMRAAFRGAVGTMSPSGASPIGTPVLTTGMSPAVRDWAAPQLEEFGFTLVSGGEAGSDPSHTATLRAGSPVGAELMRGDLSMAATGTVTWVEDDRVYAFGHPFLGFGGVELPMVSATVVHTLGDLGGSSKLANIGGEVGAIFEDRLSAVVGRLGQKARLVPLDLRVRGAGYGEQDFHFEMARSKTLGPLLAGAAVSNALVRNIARDQRATMRLSGTVRLGGLSDLPVEMAFAGEGAADPSLAIAGRLQTILAGLWRNPLAEIEIEGIDLEVQVRPELLSYQLEALQYDRGPVRAGQTFDIICQLRMQHGGSEQRTISLQIPRGIPEGTELRVLIGPPDQIDLGLGRPTTRRLQSARSAEALVGALGKLGSAHRLTATLVLEAPGVVSRGESYEALPPTAERLLSGGSRSGASTRMRYSRLSTSEVELDGPVQGGLALRLRVDSASAPHAKETR